MEGLLYISQQITVIRRLLYIQRTTVFERLFIIKILTDIFESLLKYTAVSDFICD